MTLNELWARYAGTEAAARPIVVVLDDQVTRTVRTSTEDDGELTLRVHNADED